MGFPAIAAVVLGSAGAYFVLVHAPDRRAEAVESWRQRLEVAADQRRLALELWVDDGIAAVEGVASYPLVRALVNPRERTPGARIRSVADVEEVLTYLVSERGHRGTLVVDASMRVVARSARLEDPTPADFEAAKETMTTGAPVCAFGTHGGGEAVVTFAAPIDSATGDEQGPAPQGAVIVSADPSEWLYPFITTPPIPAKTAESLLVRRDGGDLLFLSPLRHDTAPPLTLRRPLEVRESAAQAAVGGRQVFGAFEDYRGVRVLAATRRIDPTNWGFVTKVDLDEALMPFRRRMWGEALGLGSLLIAILGIALVAVRADRLRREGALARAHVRLGLLLDQANDAILFLSPEGRIVEANDRAGSFYGCPIERLVGMDVRDLCAEEERRDVDWRLSQCRREGSAVFEACHRRLDGLTLPVEVSLRVALADESPGFIDVTRDISERKRSDERFKVVAETMSDLLYEWDLGDKVDWYGDIDRMLGFGPGEYLRTAAGHTATIHPGDLARVMEAVDRHLRGEAPYELEYRVQRKDGSYAHWFARGKALRGPDGSAVRWVGAVTDVTQRKMAEEALASEQALFRGLMDTIPDAIYFKDAESRFTRINLAQARRFGLSDPAQAVAKSDFDFFAEEHARPAREDEQSIMQTGQPLVGKEEKETWPDGSVGWVITTKMPLRDARGRIVGTFGVSRDITERKSAEDTLRESEAQYRGMYASMNEGLAVHRLVHDASGRAVDYEITGVNPAFESITGLSAAEVVGRKASEVYGTGTAPHLDTYARVAETGQPVRFETEFEGMRKHFGISAFCPGRNQFATVFEDITERKRVEADLRFQTLLLTTQQEGSPDGILVVDEKGQIVSFNHRFVEMWGIPQEVVERKDDTPVLRFVSEQVTDRDSFLERVQHLYENQRETSREEIGLKNGRTFDRYSAPMFGSDDRYYGRMWYFHDITERKESEKALLQAKEALFQSQKIEAIGLLAGGIAHDFNNILGVILGYGQMLERSLDADHPGYPRLGQILIAARRAADLTHQLLAFSRKQVLQMEVVDLNALVREVEAMLLRLIEEDVGLVTRLAPKLGSIRADPGQFSQILVNLAVNARDAMPEGGTLTIETTNEDVDEAYASTHPPMSPGPFVSLSVSDTGTGMDEATRQRVFEPFFTTKAPGEGTGLGLSTVYGIVKQSEGFIWVYSEPGIGTTFKILLPRVSDAVTASGAAPVDLRVEASDTEDATVLVVEDQDSMRQMIGEILEDEGYRVLVAADGDDALRVAERHRGPIDVLLTDVVMPGMTGRTLAERLSASRPGLRVLYMSGYTRDVVARRGILEDNVLLLEKPFTAAALLRRVREARARPRP